MITFAQTDRSSPRIARLSHLKVARSFPVSGSAGQLSVSRMVHEATRRSFGLGIVWLDVLYACW